MNPYGEQKRTSSLNDSNSTANSTASNLVVNKNIRSNSMNNTTTTNSSSSGTNQTQKNVNNQAQNVTKAQLRIKIPQNILILKDKLLFDLSTAIQLAQKAYLDKEEGNRRLTNSDYQVHELCQQFDYVLLFGLKNMEETYWKIVLEFTHPNVKSDLNSLLNVTTNLGKGRAWIYHALNDNLMESYFNSFLLDKKFINKHYNKDASLMADDQNLHTLSTMVSGLENVEFKLFNDVPYLDHSCWPTHLKIKRHVVDTIMNSSTQSLSQIVDFNNSLLDSINSNYSPSGLVLQRNSVNDTTIPGTVLNIAGAKHSNKKIQRKSSRQANNISFDNSTTSSTNNLSDVNYASEYTDDTAKLSYQSSIPKSLPSDHLTSNLSFNKKSLKSRKQKNRKIKSEKDSTQDDEADEETNDEDNNNNNNNNNNNSNNNHHHKTKDLKSEFSSSDSAVEVERMANEITSNQNDQIEDEIDKLRIQNNLLKNNQSLNDYSNIENKYLKNQIKKSNTISTSIKLASSFNSSNHELAASSLKASNQFDKKIEHIENYSQIIENATLKMDACVKDMSNLYQNYEKIYNDSPDGDLLTDESTSIYKTNENSINNQSNTDNILENSKIDQDFSVYDSTNKSNEKDKIKETSQVIFSSSSMTSLNTNNTNNEIIGDDVSSKYDLYSIGSTSSKQNSKIDNENEDNYLSISNSQEDVKQEIKVDNNTKLMLSIEILQNGAHEDLIKLYHVTRGHSQGEIEAIILMITTFGIYILKKKETKDSIESTKKNSTCKFIKETFINHDQIDYIELSLSDQSIHFVCFSKRQNCWITTASRHLTSCIMENFQSARLQNKSLKFSKITVFNEATQQKLAIKKFISNEENSTPQDIEIKSYSLVFWEDQASAVDHLIHKEGTLYYYHKSGSSNSSSEWKKAYYILKNDVLAQYRSQNDKRPTSVIKLNGEDFIGCRKNNKVSKPHTIELILSNSNTLYLSAKSEPEASDWLQCFCRTISLGNYHTDVPSHSCLPCCSVITNNKVYFCHEDLNTGFYRLLESIKLQEINRISFDNENPFFCILHDDIDTKKVRYWFVYFMDKIERDEFITNFKETWELLFQVQFTVEKCKSSEMRKRCIKSVKTIHISIENNNELN